MPLQDFRFNVSSYERPQQPWRCGREDTGRPCGKGPDLEGRCSATHECLPLKRGDRWFCTATPPCEDGPLPRGQCSRPVRPCVPKASLLALRGHVGGWITLFTVSMLAFVLGHSDARYWSPGALSPGHSIFTERCEACHANDTEIPLAWMGEMFEHDPATFSRRCLTCHDQGANALHAHSVAAEALPRPIRENVVSKASWWFSALDMIGGASERGDIIHCVACHNEHHPDDEGKRGMSVGQCQSCHTRRFLSFDGGHPEFGEYPFVERTRIIFDHVGHYEKHFKEKEWQGVAPRDCTDCHRLQPDGAMNVRGFETMCANCHGGQIMGDGFGGELGVAVLSVPGFDIATLSSRGYPMGQWPDWADGAVTAFMGFLLARGEKIKDAMERVEELKDPLDLSTTGDEALAEVRKLGWSIKDLIAEMAISGYTALAAPLGKGPRARLAAAERGGQIAQPVIQSMVREWFPNLLTEVARHRAGLPPLEPETVSGESHTEERTENSVAGDEEVTKMPESGLLTTSEEDSGLILDESTDVGHDLLGRTTDESTDNLLMTGGDAGDGADSLLESGADRVGDETMVAPPPAEVGRLAPVASDMFVSGGGWYLRDSTLYYRPNGHADTFMVAWLDLTGSTTDTYSRELFDKLISPKGPGLCGKCHSIDRAGDKRTVNWRARHADAVARGFDRFSHQPHLMHNESCRNCHEMDPSAKYSRNFETDPPSSVQHNFHSIKRNSCRECHAPGKAGESCILCHNYHVQQQS